MYIFLKEEDKTTLNIAFPFVQICNADFYQQGLSSYADLGLKPYLINSKSVAEFKDPFILIEDVSVGKPNNDEVTLEIRQENSLINITVSNDTLIAWF